MAAKDNITIEECEVKHGWLKRLFMGLAALVITVGGLLFTLATDNGSALGTMNIRVENNKENIKEVKADLKEIKNSQQIIRVDTAKILAELRAGHRNITKGNSQ